MKRVFLLILGITLASCNYAQTKKSVASENKRVQVTENILDKYRYVDPFKEGLATVSIDKKRGFIDKTGKLVIPCKYDVAYDFENGFSIVISHTSPGVNDKYGFINKAGKEITPIKYDFAGKFEGGRALVKLDKKYGFIDERGKEVIPVIYEDANSFEEDDLTTVKLDGQWFVIDKNNNRKATLTDVESVSSFTDGLASVKVAGKPGHGYIDRKGKIVIEPKYDLAFYFNEGLAAVEIADRHGIINKKGEEVTPLIYDGYPSFREGRAAVSRNGKYGFIDKTGKEIIPLKYDDVYDFWDGTAGVCVGRKWGCIDTTGKEILPPIYTTISSGEGILAVLLDGEWQFLDQTGKPLFPEKFEDAYSFSDGAA
ncbi:MAG: WG repeat-containing protein, partial [Flavobacterium sp.]